MKKVTESESLYHDLEKKSTLTLLEEINQEDQKVSLAVQKTIPILSKLVDAVYQKMKSGGRLFYIGAGTSGRLGILDASECPPTFGVPDDWVIGLIAGGDKAIRKSQEFAEDSRERGWQDLLDNGISEADIVIGVAASGTTPYVEGALKVCQEKGIVTGSITCNPDNPIAKVSDYPIIAIVGPEYVTGSTRMKSGTAQKLILNMISTSVMIKLGRVLDNRMVDMQLANNKLIDRGAQLILHRSGLDYEEAKNILLKAGSVRAALNKINEDENC
jgi:N-acetylmuramic acid 6-phosphate etherase